MKCQVCDKPLSKEEVYENTFTCFDCENESHIGRLRQNLAKDRFTKNNWEELDGLLVDMINVTMKTEIPAPAIKLVERKG
jgi:hypothetical protein